MGMARTQDLALNPTKVSGVCGRLLCCLSYENEQYKAAQGRPAPARSAGRDQPGLGPGHLAAGDSRARHGPAGERRRAGHPPRLRTHHPVGTPRSHRASQSGRRRHLPRRGQRLPESRTRAARMFPVPTPPRSSSPGPPPRRPRPMPAPRPTRNPVGTDGAGAHVARAIRPRDPTPAEPVRVPDVRDRPFRDDPGPDGWRSNATMARYLVIHSPREDDDTAEVQAPTRMVDLARQAGAEDANPRWVTTYDTDMSDNRVFTIWDADDPSRHPLRAGQLRLPQPHGEQAGPDRDLGAGRRHRQRPGRSGIAPLHKRHGRRRGVPRYSRYPSVLPPTGIWVGLLTRGQRMGG